MDEWGENKGGRRKDEEKEENDRCEEWNIKKYVKYNQRKT